MTKKLFFYSLFSLFGLMLASTASATTSGTTPSTTTTPTTTTVTTTAPTATTTPVAKEKAEKAIDLVCMQKATAKREAAIVKGLKAYHDTWEASFAKRTTNLDAAWKIEDTTARKAALKSTWKTYRDEKKAALKIYNKERVAVWKTFRTERKECGTQAVSEDTSTSGGASE